MAFERGDRAPYLDGETSDLGLDVPRGRPNWEEPPFAGAFDFAEAYSGALVCDDGRSDCFGGARGDDGTLPPPTRDIASRLVVAPCRFSP